MLLNEGKKVWPPMMINCGEITGKYMGELTEDEGYFSIFVCTGSSWGWVSVSGDKVTLFILT